MQGSTADFPSLELPGRPHRAARRGRSFALAAALTAAFTLPAAAAGAAAGGAQHPITHTLSTIGGPVFVANQYMKDTMRFAQSEIWVHSGQTLTLAAKDQETDPHTLTLVRAKDLPVAGHRSPFNCAVCAQAQTDHGATMQGPPTHPLVTKYGDPTKFDAPGDSVIFMKGQSAQVAIGAKPGTTLRFLCAIHPWMQGTIHVIK